VDGSTTRPTASAFGELEPSESERLGRLGGILVLAGTAVGFPASLAIEPPPGLADHVITLLGVLSGLLLLILPWRRISPGWFHVVILAGVLEVTVATAVYSHDFSFYYVIVAAYAAYIVREARVLRLYEALFTVALLAPLAYVGDQREHLHHVLVILPVLLIVAVIVRHLRDSVEARERRYREFALEAAELSARLETGAR